MRKNPIFADNDYKQQANSIKMTINWIVPAVKAHVREGKLQGKEDVDDYAAKVISQLELIVNKLKQVS